MAERSGASERTRGSEVHVRGLLIIEDMDRRGGEIGPLDRPPVGEGRSLLVVVNRTQRAVWNFNVKGYASGI